MIDVSQWRASIGLWNSCQAASSRQANAGQLCHSFEGVVDSKSGSITTKALTAALPILAFIFLFISFTLHLIKLNYILLQAGIDLHVKM